MTGETRAIVLGRERRGEQSLSVHLLSEGMGRVYATAKGALSGGAGGSGALDLMFQVRVTLAQARGGRAYVREVELEEGYGNVTRHFARLQVACYFGELIRAILPEGEPSKDHYDLMNRALHYLNDYAPDLRVVARFESRLLALEGLAEAGGPGLTVEMARLRWEDHVGPMPAARDRVLAALT